MTIRKLGRPLQDWAACCHELAVHYCKPHGQAIVSEPKGLDLRDGERCCWRVVLVDPHIDRGRSYYGNNRVFSCPFAVTSAPGRQQLLVLPGTFPCVYEATYMLHGFGTYDDGDAGCDL